MILKWLAIGHETLSSNAENPTVEHPSLLATIIAKGGRYLPLFQINRLAVWSVDQSVLQEMFHPILS